jgi:hypothetical protein
MAHDFNNMLGVIVGYCDLAKGRASLEGAVKDVSQIKKAAQRTATLTVACLQPATGITAACAQSQ